MKIKTITEKEKKEYNQTVSHPLQSFEWGEFRQKTGITVVRKGVYDNDTLTNGFQLTIHKIPHTPFTIGYLPKGLLPTPELIQELQQLGKIYNSVFIQLEPAIEVNTKNAENFFALQQKTPHFIPSTHPLFTKNTFILDLTKSEEELLKNMHPKTRYNIKIAKKHNVTIREEQSNEAFEIYWKLMQETTTRQGFYAHTKTYHKIMWETLHNTINDLQSHLFIAYYKPPEEKKEIPLVAWILFTFHNSLYYPYGASSNLYRNVMASNLMMWEAINFGKKRGLTHFDMWGSLGENPNLKDPWYGFHKLKMGYGPKLLEFVGSYDLIINPLAYQGYKVTNTLRWFLLRFKK